MKIYIAAHDQIRARKLAEKLEAAGHEISSSWVRGEFKRTDNWSILERQEIAKGCTDEVLFSDALVLLDSADKVPGGKFVEMGVALGLGKWVIVSGRRENVLCWHPFIKQVGSDEQVLYVIAAIIP